MCLLNPELVLAEMVNLDFVQADCAKNSFDNRVWITVGARATIFEIAFAVIGNTTWNPNGTTAVSNTSVEVVDRRCFVLSSQASFVIFSPTRIVSFDVCWMIL